MTFRYYKKIIWKELILGSLFFILGIYFAVTEPDNIFRYGFIVVGLLHLISGIYQLKMPYLKFDNGSLIRGGLISKSVSLSEVEKIRKFAGDYTLFTSDKKLKINSELVNKSQREELNKYLRSLDVTFEEASLKEYKYS
ncbi:hypothetical protein [Salinimicrobium xinjiangense]|uniref:hypothetical protein n=1 Tax=Salinimicrobium xinjiangense TaxID=438596 RepID=UPI0004269002|nr:hypothetical protein [Salinimicrobium xinjiangense]